MVSPAEPVVLSSSPVRRQHRSSGSLGSHSSHSGSASSPHSSPGRSPPPAPRDSQPPLSRDSQPGSAVYLGVSDSADPIRPPPIQRMTSGFGSVRVGLGSPKLNFGRDWVGGKRKESSEPEQINGDEQEQRDITLQPINLEETNHLRNQLGLKPYGSSSDLGLPSPPRTDSDIAMPAARSENSRRTSASADSVSSPILQENPMHIQTDPDATSTRSPRPNAAQRSYSTSSSISSRHSDSPAHRNKVLKPRASPPIAYPAYSPSEQALYPRDHGFGHTNGTAKQPITTHTSKRGGSAGSSSSQTTRQRDKALYLDGDLQDKRSNSSASSASSSRAGRHRHLPSISPSRSDSDHNTHNSKLSYEDQGIGDSQPDDLDERIRLAEEQIQRTYRRRSRTRIDLSDDISPVRDTIRRVDRHSDYVSSPVAGNSLTLRSATVSSASARTPNGDERNAMPYGRDVPDNRIEGDGSGSSGGLGRREPLPADFRTRGLFTPSPKPSPTAANLSHADPSSSTRPSHMSQYDSPTSYGNASPLRSRFSTTSRLAGGADPESPRPYSRTSRIEGLERSSSVVDSETIAKREWKGLVTGTTRKYFGLEDNDLPLPRNTQKRERLRERHHLDSSAGQAQSQSPRDNVQSRISTRYGDTVGDGITGGRYTGSRTSKLHLTPADSISVVGAQQSEDMDTPTKDPLEVLRRIEAQRTQHNRQWDRAASVMGDHQLPRPDSRFSHTPPQVRPATSMSGLREQYMAARTAPVQRHRRPPTEVDSPSLNRVGSRMSQIIHPSSEPRTMRASTSLGGQSVSNLEIQDINSEHGRLLFEAFRSFEGKLADELQNTMPSFLATTRTSADINKLTHDALQLVRQLAVDIEIDPRHVAEDLNKLTSMLREAGRASDQNIRELTRILLDLPKQLREGSGSRMSNDIPKRWRPSSPSTFDSPLSRTEQPIRASTSMGDYYSPSKRIARNPIPAEMTNGQDRSDTSSSPFVSRIRALATTPRKDDLPPIEDSPPATLKPSYNDGQQPIPPPKSPDQPRQVLRKKVSTTSTNTVRGSTFMPSASKNRTTTAVSAITAGDISPTRARSLRSQKSSLDFGTGEPSSPMSRFSFHTAEEHGENGVEVDAVSLLAQAAKRREEGTIRAGLGGKGVGGNGSGDVLRRPSMSERFRATLRRNGTKEGK